MSKTWWRKLRTKLVPVSGPDRDAVTAAGSYPAMEWVLESYLAERLETLRAELEVFNGFGHPDTIEWYPGGGSLRLAYDDGSSATFASSSRECEQVAAMGKLGPVSCRARTRGDGRIELTARLEHWQYLVVADSVLLENG
jgi:hypothetical protein